MGLHTVKSGAVKGKSRKRNEKHGKVKFPTKGNKNTSNIINSDLSGLRKPIDTSVSALHQVSKLLETGTHEVKSILSYECDIIYECRTCRNLFRSIINLISHKREYCRERFDMSFDRNLLSNPDVTIIKDAKDVRNGRTLKSRKVFKEYPQKQDLGTLVDILNKKQEENINNNLFNETEIKNELPNAPNEQHVYLESIDTNCSPVYQNIKSSNTVVDTTDLMKAQVAELQDIIDQGTITLQGQMSENQLEKSDSPIQIDMCDEANQLSAPTSSTNNLACNICNATFSTKKTLNVHMKTLHTTKRVCYGCPCCISTFANTWSVYRHLYKVHKKTHEQVRKLKSLVQEKVFHRKTSVTKGARSARAIETSTLKSVTMTNSNKCQELVDHVDSNMKLQSCNKRRKKSDTKIPLSTHSEPRFQMPIDTCNKIDTERSDEALSDLIPINDRSVCKMENVDTIINCSAITRTSRKTNTNTIFEETSSSSPGVYKHYETSIRVQDASDLAKEDWNMPTENINEDESLSTNEGPVHSVSDKSLPDALCIKADDLRSLAPKLRYKKRKLLSRYARKLTDLREKDMINVHEDKSTLQFSPLLCSDDKDQTLSIESKIAAMANFQKLQCLPCKRRFTSMPNLRRHMAIHVGWNRYRCKLCDFKCFAKCDCVIHCNKVHNAQHDRVTIAELVIEIPRNGYTCNENYADVTNAREELNDSNVINIVPSNQSETSPDLNNMNNSNVRVSSQVEDAIINEQAVEPYGDVDTKNVDEVKIMTMENLTDYMTNHGSGKLDANPDLKRMVMEVIFGSSDTNTVKHADSDKATLKIDGNTRDHTDAKNDGNNTAVNAESKKISYPSANTSLRHQRPMRNRIKPLNADFVYDLKKIASRKESAVFNDPGVLDVRKKPKLYN